MRTLLLGAAAAFAVMGGAYAADLSGVIGQGIYAENSLNIYGASQAKNTIYGLDGGTLLKMASIDYGVVPAIDIPKNATTGDQGSGGVAWDKIASTETIAPTYIGAGHGKYLTNDTTTIVAALGYEDQELGTLPATSALGHSQIARGFTA